MLCQWSGLLQGNLVLIKRVGGEKHYKDILKAYVSSVTPSSGQIVATLSTFTSQWKQLEFYSFYCQ